MVNKFCRSLLLLLICSTSACSQLESEDGALKWAHNEPSIVGGGLFSMSEALRLGLSKQTPELLVCMGRNRFKTITDNELELEVKLAYVAWLRAADAKNIAALWSTFKFVRAETCDFSDSTYASVINLAGSAEAKIRRFPFNVPMIKCMKAGQYSTNCAGEGLTLGWGGVGLADIESSRRDKLVRIEVRSPAVMAFNPYVNWQSLASQIDSAKVYSGNPSQAANQIKLAAAVSAKIKSKYRELASKSNEVELNELMTLEDLLSSNRIIIAADRGFSKKMQEIIDQNAFGLSKRFTPEYSLYHILLHEVGHQFGMSHADNPNAGDVTGSSSKATLANGVWTTEESAMAYGLSYAFLTGDDKAGIADLAQKLSRLLQDTLKRVE